MRISTIFSEDEAEVDAHADGVATYSEVCARPDNEVSKKPSSKGWLFAVGQFMPATYSRGRNFARLGGREGGARLHELIN